MPAYDNSHVTQEQYQSFIDTLVREVGGGLFKMFMWLVFLPIAVFVGLIVVPTVIFKIIKGRKEARELKMQQAQIAGMQKQLGS